MYLQKIDLKQTTVKTNDSTRSTASLTRQSTTEPETFCSRKEYNTRNITNDGNTYDNPVVVPFAMEIIGIQLPITRQGQTKITKSIFVDILAAMPR